MNQNGPWALNKAWLSNLIISDPDIFLKVSIFNFFEHHLLVQVELLPSLRLVVVQEGGGQGQLTI